jgi:thermostable 8-oxoguanine DNA glycosylase
MRTPVVENPNTVLRQIESTLDSNGFDYRGWIDSFGQVRGFEKRQSGQRFGLDDHVRGLVLAQLSNQRPWGPIAANLDKLSAIFLHYDPQALKAANPAELAESVKKIRCGNRQIARQTQFLRENIEVLESIDNLDNYVVSLPPAEIARSFAEGPYKLKQVGMALAMEYLRNVGVNCVKPDLHICRMIGPERLGLVREIPTPEEAINALDSWAEKSDRSLVYMDNLLWLFAAQDYAAICGANPRCSICQVAACNARR